VGRQTHVRFVLEREGEELAVSFAEANGAGAIEDTQ
jgi:hypothetical protein